MATHCTSEADIQLLLKSVKKHLAHLLLLACVADGSFHFSGREIEHAGEQTSAPGLSKKWGEVLPQPLPPAFFLHSLSAFSFPSVAFGNELLLEAISGL